MKKSSLIIAGLSECRLHVKRLNFAMNKLKGIFPVILDQWRNLSEEDIEAMDQLVFRFTKLQDSLGLRVFPRLLDLLDEPLENSPMIDKLNRLEKLGVIEEVVIWQELRNLRNNLTHEYPDQDKDNCERFNYFIKNVDVLIEISRRTESWTVNKFPIIGSELNV